MQDEYNYEIYIIIVSHTSKRDKDIYIDYSQNPNYFVSCDELLEVKPLD